MTLSAINPSSARFVHGLLEESESLDGTPLPLAGWRLHQRVQHNGRVVIEINDDGGELVGLITSTDLPMLSVDGAWRGWSPGTDGTPRWWALAVGHASAGTEEPVVSFARRVGRRANPHRTVVRPLRVHGLWIAAIPGLHTTVTCRQGAEQRLRRLAPVPRLHVHV